MKQSKIKLYTGLRRKDKSISYDAVAFENSLQQHPFVQKKGPACRSLNKQKRIALVCNLQDFQTSNQVFLSPYALTNAFPFPEWSRF